MLAITHGIALVAILGLATLGMVVANAVLATISTLLRCRVSRLMEDKSIHARTDNGTIFFSVHVATYDEPPEILIATLNALSRLHYPKYEVIVLDNNTPNAATWIPVAEHCAKLGPRFRFFHRDGVAGAKAGALNIALTLTNHEATHVVVVDADYVVDENFLSDAATALETEMADYLQFPQAYLHGESAMPVATELGDYFRGHAVAANATRSMLLTGTLSVISISWLRRVGGWPTGTITEDADLGLKLYTSGARGVFVNRIVGRGLLPLDFTGLVLQRQRWVAGNMQTLARGLSQPSFRNGLHGGLSIFAQLLAWPQFAAFPVMALVASALVRLLDVQSPPWPLVEVLAAGTLFAIFAAMLAEQVLLKRQLEAVPVKLALLWVSSLAWIPLLWGRRLRFHRTPKAGRGAAKLPAYMKWGGLLLPLPASALAATGAPLSSLALLLPLLSLPAAVMVDCWLTTSSNRKDSHALPDRDSDLQPC